MTEEDRARDEFLNHVKVMTDYWMNLEPDRIPAGETELSWKMNGLAFSIMVAIDGGAAVGPYELKPIYDDYGNEYDEDNPAPDIGGCLHELMDRVT
jgi:hypothetical protein